MAYENKPNKSKSRRGQVNLFPLTPALFSTIDLNNLYIASQEVRKQVNWKDSVLGFQANLIVNLVTLREEVLNGKYKMRPYKEFIIYEPKKRKIEATCHRDRVIQHSLCDTYLYHALTRHFIYDNAANQVGKGTDFARNRFKCQLHRYWLKNGSDGYCAYVDIHSFFDSIKHDVALQVLSKKAPDAFAVQYCSLSMENHDGEVGVGLGSELSQLIALSVLDGVDHFAKEKLRAKWYIRYMDDSVALFPTKQESNIYLS